jgi:hypothetical protein
MGNILRRFFFCFEKAAVREAVAIGPGQQDKPGRSILLFYTGRD